MVRVVLADSGTTIGAEMRSVLDEEQLVEVVAETADGRAAVEAVRRHRPQVVLLDVRLPDLGGLAVLAELRQVAPDASVVMVTRVSHDDHIVEALTSGASGFVVTSGDPHGLRACLHAVAGGGAYLSPQVAGRVLGRLAAGAPVSRSAEARGRVDDLSRRDQRLLRLVGSGMTNAEISDEMCLVEGTVKAYVSTLFQRLGLRNRVQAAILAYQAGLVGGPE